MMFNYASPTAEMLLTAVLLKPQYFSEVEPLKGICHNKMYTITGYTIEQINCDDNGAYEDFKSAKTEYAIEIKGDEIIKANVVHKEGEKYIQNVRAGRSYERTVADPTKVYAIERYYRKNKSFPGLRHMVVKVKNVMSLHYEKYLCVVYSNSDERKINSDFSILPHGNSTKSQHPYIRTSKNTLERESELLGANQPFQTYENLVKETDPFTSTSQSNEPRNVKQIHNRQYLLKQSKKNQEVIHCILFILTII